MERNTERERAHKTERRQHRAQRRLEAATEVTRSNRAARHTSDGLAGPWLSGTKPGPGAQECRNASNTAAMNCIGLALSLASSLRSDPA